MQEVIISQDKQNNKIVALVENGKLVEKYEEKSGSKKTRRKYIYWKS